VSRGNAEQPSAQTPQGHNSPSRVETAVQDRGPIQRIPEARGPRNERADPEEWPLRPQDPADTGTQDPVAGPREPKPRPSEGVHRSPNGQAKDSRPPSPGMPVRPQQTASRTPGGPASAPPTMPQQAPSPPPQHPPHPQQRPQPQQAQAPTQQRPQPQQAQAPTQQRPQPQSGGQAAHAVPVWDPPQPPQPKQPLLGRLGFGKKAEELQWSSPGGATAAISAPSPQARTPAQYQPGMHPGGQVNQQAPPAPPRMPHAPEDVIDTSRTPPVPGAVRPGPASHSPAPQARMPAPPVQPGAPGPFPIPAPVQALRDSTTQTTSVVPTAPVTATPHTHDALKPKAGVARRTRKARLRLSRLDPWSVMKTSFLFSIAAGIMLVVAVYSIWTVLSTSGLFESINQIVASVVSTPGDTTPFRVEEYINTQKVMGVTALIACVDVVIFTALATLGSFLYNLAATMLGGLEITLAED
jgi:Transmembrane domain of unknown function (DUF3566)